MIKTATFLALILSASVATAATLSQPKVELRKNKPGAINILNDSLESLNVRVEVTPENHAASLKKLPADFAKCEKSTKAFPKLFQLKPGAHQQVNFIAREIGNCRVIFYTNKIKELAEAKTASPDGTVFSDSDSNEVGGTTTDFNYALPIIVK